MATPEKARNSSWELLRVIAMSMILIGHFNCHAITFGPLSHLYVCSMLPVVNCGVNLFYMISGWFLVKYSLNNIFSLSITVFIFTFINIIALQVVGVPVSINVILNTFLFPISKSAYWFIAVYLFLILLAPIINSGLKNLNIVQLRKLMIVFTFIEGYSCGIGHNWANPGGFTYLQALYCYSLAYYLHRDYALLAKVPRYIYGITFLGCILVAASGYYFLDKMTFCPYNSFLTIGACTALFMLIASMNFKSKVVNYLGGGFRLLYASRRHFRTSVFLPLFTRNFL